MQDLTPDSGGYEEFSLLGYNAVSSETFNGLRGIISQKIEPFITTAMGTTNPAIACPTQLGNVVEFALYLQYRAR
jgi:hypothetical protein